MRNTKPSIDHNHLQLLEEILKIPRWRRFLICLIAKRKEWKVAKAYNIIAIDAAHLGDYQRFMDMAEHAAAAFAKVYDIKYPT